MNTAILTPAPTTKPRTTSTPDRKVLFGTAAFLIAVTAVGLALGAGGDTAGALPTGATVPSADAGSHVTPDHIVQPR